MNLIAKYVATEYFRTVCASKKELLGGDRVPYLDTVFDMMERTYRSIGIPVSNPNTMLQKYPVWWLYFHNEVPVFPTNLPEPITNIVLYGPAVSSYFTK